MRISKFYYETLLTILRNSKEINDTISRCYVKQYLKRNSSNRITISTINTYSDEILKQLQKDGYIKRLKRGIYTLIKL